MTTFTPGPMCEYVFEVCEETAVDTGRGDYTAYRHPVWNEIDSLVWIACCEVSDG